MMVNNHYTALPRELFQLNIKQTTDNAIFSGFNLCQFINRNLCFFSFLISFEVFYLEGRVRYFSYWFNFATIKQVGSFHIKFREISRKAMPELSPKFIFSPSQ